ncbi:MAG: hypothetical protein V1875_05890 [Candidatus Altiarchaeota archaeon]
MRIYAALIALVILMGCMGTEESKTKVTRDGDAVVYQRNDHTVTMLSGKPIVGQYLVVGGGSFEELHYEATFAMIPLQSVKELEERYGSFLKCKSAGAIESEKNTEYYAFMSEDENVRNKIAEIVKLAGEYKYPLIELKGTGMTIIKHQFQYQGRDVPFKYTGKEQHILIDEIDIKEKDYIGKRLEP